MNQLKGPSCPAQTGLGLPDFTKPQAATATQSGVGMACLCAIPKLAQPVTLDRWGTLAQDSRCHSYNHVTFSRVGPPFIPPFVGGLHRVTLPPLFICSEALPQMLQLPVAPIRTWRRHPGTRASAQPHGSGTALLQEALTTVWAPRAVQCTTCVAVLGGPAMPSPPHAGRLQQV